MPVGDEVPSDVREPSPGDPEFYDKKLMYVCSRQPRFERASTYTGAPSDFCIRSRGADVLFDLMKDGVLQRMADYIFGLYDNDMDRLMGAMMFVNQPEVVRHVGNKPEAGLLSLFRQGQFFCQGRNMAFVGLVSHLRKEDGSLYEARGVVVPGHFIAAVRGDGPANDIRNWIPIDADHGVMFFNEGNTRFATFAELAENHDLIRRSNINHELCDIHMYASLENVRFSSIHRGGQAGMESWQFRPVYPEWGAPER